MSELRAIREYGQSVEDIRRNLDDTAQFRAEAEQAILATSLLDPGILLEHLAVIRPADIRDNVLRELFELVAAMQKTGIPVNANSVLMESKRSGLIDRLGGVVGLNTVLESQINVSNAAYYRNELRRLAKADRFYQLTLDASVRLSHKRCDVESELAYLASSLANDEPLNNSMRTADELLAELENDIPWSRCSIEFGIPSIDYLIGGGLDMRQLLLLGARFGKGKTTLACQLFTNAIIGKHPSVFFSLEMTGTEIAQRMASNEKGIPMTAWRRGQRTVKQREAIRDFRRELQDAKCWIDDSATLTVETIRQKCEYKKIRDGLDLIVIDNLQLINNSLGKNERNDVQVTHVSKSLKRLAKDLDCAVVLLCQLDTEAAKQRPTSANWASAKAIEGDADIAMMLHQPKEDSNEYEVIATKIRNGKPGTVVCAFDGLYQRFETVIENNSYANDFQTQ